ncbi:hypothetical protein F0U60_20350 [Archangium minus]|uniref:Uncharacterized protein n=1 Tax=Archangium minus TaxID=83450 RepID=A0ABY9WVE0_9BACT|nr:hypothetical protein F0U61_20425 [Archangium violaceum]WNG46207.1 hypothetical protein F0U60_20350 [Archangium minus]
MSTLVIDRLALKLSGLDESQGRQLARLLSEGFAAASLPEGASASTRSLQVDVRARSGEPLEALSDRIVAQVLRELQRTV